MSAHQPLNYTPKAIASLLAMPCPNAPAARAGLRYLAAKLDQAQVFVLSDHGQLLDRGKPRPEVPGVLFKPPFPIVALEYSAATLDWEEGFYTSSKCSRRIALAWEWQDDLPAALANWTKPDLGPGVIVASIAYYDASGQWTPIPAAMHLAYDEVWQKVANPLPYHAAMVASGRLAKDQSASPSMAMTPIAIMPEALAGIAAHTGMNGLMDVLSADTMDEVNAYTDLCYALACRNVSRREYPAPDALNKHRIKAGKLPIKGFHVLELAGGGDLPGAGGGGDRSGPRSHLRRGHIRRLGGDRVTWVNSSVVRGRGFVDKVYAL